MGLETTHSTGAVLADRSAADDPALVEAVRRGDDRAFEELYWRYGRRVTGYVHGMVKDHGRAEDVTQEVFVSALRRMRATGRAIAFRPWIFEIARNACIDAYRRTQRTDEVPIDAERLPDTAPAPEAAVAVKEELDTLRGAFRGLSDTHHEILVMRELEGRSYADIGERMGLTRPAVESTLFRARRRLGEEFGELASGERCLRVRAIALDAAEGAKVGARDRRRVASHAAHCDPCRRLAARAGLGVEPPRRTRVARRLGGWLPFPALLRRSGEHFAAHLPALGEPLHSVSGKAAAGLAALLIAGAGAGVTAQSQGSPAPRAVAATPAAAPSRPAVKPTVASTRDSARGAAELRPAAERTPVGGAGRPAPGDDGRARPTAPVRDGGGENGRDATEQKTTQTVKRAADDAGKTVRRAGDDAGETVRRAGDDVGETVRRAGDDAGETVRRTGDDLGETVQDAGTKLGQTVQNAGSDAGQAVTNAGSNAGQAVQKAGSNAGQAVQNAGSNAGQAVQKAGSNAGQAVQNVPQTLQQPQQPVQDVTKTASDAAHDAGAIVDAAAGDARATVGGLLGP